jgi:adenylyltransferase/sulfurtransferase
MAVRVLIPTPLRPYTGQQSSLHVDGRTVGEVIRHLTSEHTDLKPHLYRDDGRLRTFVNLYVNDEDIRDLAGENTAVSETDTVSIVPSVAGGSGITEARTDLPELSSDEVARYSRHLIMPEVGLEGQRKLKAARVLCVGAGGLGSPASLYLAAAGVGTLGLVDFDVVDSSNLQRQILYSTGDVGRPKLEAARRRLTELNPGIRIVTHEGPLTSANALDIIGGYDLVIDGADNFPARYLVNDACVLLGKPNVYGSIFRFDGQVSVFATANGPCYRCLYPEPPPPGLVPSCAEGGVLGILPGIIGTMQAAEAIKLIIGAGEPLVGRLLLFDALEMSTRTMKLRRDPACVICSPQRTITKLIDYEQFCGVVPARAQAPALPPELVTTVEVLSDRVRRGDPVWILDVREPREYEIARIAGSTLIPLGELPRRLDEIPRGDAAPDVVVHCKSGARSAKAVALLRERGFERVKNLEGGILAWIDRVDPTQSKY